MRFLALAPLLIAVPAAALPTFGLDQAGKLTARDPATNSNRAIGSFDGSGFNSTPQKVNVQPSANAGAWVPSVASGIYSYLPNNAAAQSAQAASGIANFASSHTAETGGAAGEVGIAFGSLCAQDRPSGSAGVWCYYGTAIRTVSTSAPTHTVELDIDNKGNAVAVTPSNINPAGVSNGLRIMAGGEAAGTDSKSVSAALIIGSNDPTYTANFAQGIVFHNRAIAGTDGATGIAPAITLATGHQLGWYRNNGNAAAYINATANPAGNGGILTLGNYNSQGGPYQINMGLVDNALTPSINLDLGAPAYRWNALWAGRINLAQMTPPSSSSQCTDGDVIADASFLYVCTATNHWKRLALSDF